MDESMDESIVYEVDFSRAVRLGVNLPQAWLLSSIPDIL